MRRSVVLGLLGLCLACAPRPRDDAGGVGSATSALEGTPRAFALIGDQQYDAREEGTFRHLMADIDTAGLDFVIHVGDIWGGRTPCTDSLRDSRRAQFDSSAHPFVLAFGDNEWADCVRTGFDPLERLSALRRSFAATGESLGRRRLALARQPGEFPEHARWSHAGVLFLTLNLPGASNNLGRGEATDAEAARRMTAALEWLRDGFSLARAQGRRAVVVAMQADPGFRRERLNAEWLGNARGYDPLLAELRRLTMGFDGQVVLVHGDTHTFIVDRPMVHPDTKRVVPNFTRVEVFGSPDAHWVRATILPDDPRVFRFDPVIVPANAAR